MIYYDETGHPRCSQCNRRLTFDEVCNCNSKIWKFHDEAGFLCCSRCTRRVGTQTHACGCI
jgi:hypothetical protein